MLQEATRRIDAITADLANGVTLGENVIERTARAVGQIDGLKFIFTVEDNADDE